jgi:hypothetical protein
MSAANPYAQGKGNRAANRLAQLENCAAPFAGHFGAATVTSLGPGEHSFGHAGEFRNVEEVAEQRQ